jgi:hypothetical protein
MTAKRVDELEDALLSIDEAVFRRSGCWREGDDPAHELFRLWADVRTICKGAGLTRFLPNTPDGREGDVTK